MYKLINREGITHKFDSFGVGHCSYVSSEYSSIVRKQSNLLLKSLFQKGDHNLIMITLNKYI